MEGELEVEDIDEALLVISLKNDQISSLKSSLKALEKKNNLRLADLQFKVDQQKSKTTQIERRTLKNEENNFKLRENYEEQIRKLQGDNSKLMQSIHELQVQQRRKQRQWKAAIFQQRLKCQREKQNGARLLSELQAIHRHYDPNKILRALNKNALQQIPNYLQLYRKYEEKSQEVKQVSLHMSKVQSQMMLGMQESFRKLSSYQAVMESLNLKNMQLQQNMKAKEAEIEISTLELSQKKQIIQSVKELATQQYQTLNEQILTLRHFVSQEQQEKQQNLNSENHLNYQSTIEELQRIIEQNEEEMKEMQDYFQEKISYLNEQNERANRQLSDMQMRLLSQREQFEQVMLDLKTVIQSKDTQILKLTTCIQEQKDQFALKKAQLETYIGELSDYINKKKKADTEHRLNQLSSKERIQALEEELNHYKLQYDHQNNQQPINQHIQQQELDVPMLKRVQSGASFVSLKQSRNLFTDIRQDSIKDELMSKADIGKYEQQPKWKELYYNLLVKHNEFAKKVKAKLQLIKG